MKLLKQCRQCKTGDCCRTGVDISIKEMLRISELKLKIKSPWFRGPYKDRDFPYGICFETLVRNGRCVFQTKYKRCLIYAVRPRYCAEFPFEDGNISPEYRDLCRCNNKKKLPK